MFTNNLYRDLLSADYTKRPIIKGTFANVNDQGVLEVCPLTNLVLENGWFTEERIRELYKESIGKQYDVPIVQEVLMAVEGEYHEEPEDVAMIYANWDESRVNDFKHFFMAYTYEMGAKI